MLNELIYNNFTRQNEDIHISHSNDTPTILLLIVCSILIIFNMRLN